MGPLWEGTTWQAATPESQSGFTEPVLRGTMAWLRWLLLAAVLGLSFITPIEGRFGVSARNLVLGFAGYSAVVAFLQWRIGWLRSSLAALALDTVIILSLVGLCGSAQCPLYFLTPLMVVPLLLSVSLPAALAAAALLSAIVSLLTMWQAKPDMAPTALQLVAFQNVILFAVSAPVAILMRAVRHKQQEVERERTIGTHLRLINEVLATGGTASDPSRISRTVAELAREAVGGDLGLVALLHDDGTIDVVWTTLPGDPYLAQRSDLGVIAELGGQSRGFLLHDTQAGPGYGLYEALGIRSCVAAPLRVGESVVGILLVGSLTPRRYRDESADWLGAIAHPAALSISNARLNAQQRVNAERLAALDNTKNDFLYTASHELRTPLAAMKIAVGLLQSRGDGDEVGNRLLASLDRNTDRLEKLVDDILDMARLQNGVLRLDWVVLDPQQLLQDVATAIMPLLNAKQQALSLETGGDLPRVWGDRRRIEQVLTNLLANANQYSGPGTPIVLAAAARRDGLLFQVRDQGPGIAAEDCRRIFEPFQRLTGGDGTTRGIGLGLAISKAIVALHNGRIWVESVPGDGSVFSVLLPATDDS